MQIVFEAKKGNRVMRGFRGVAVKSKDNLWWSWRFKCWVPLEVLRDKWSNYGATSTHHIGKDAPKTFKAFLSYLDRHPELKGCEVTLISKWVGYNVTAYL